MWNIKDQMQSRVVFHKAAKRLACFKLHTFINVSSLATDFPFKSRQKHPEYTFCDFLFFNNLDFLFVFTIVYSLKHLWILITHNIIHYCWDRKHPDKIILLEVYLLIHHCNKIEAKACFNIVCYFSLIHAQIAWLVNSSVQCSPQ